MGYQVWDYGPKLRCREDRRETGVARTLLLQGARCEPLASLIGVTKLAVFVLDRRKTPLMPCGARLCVTRGGTRHPSRISLPDRVGACPGQDRSRQQDGVAIIPLPIEHVISRAGGRSNRVTGTWLARAPDTRRIPQESWSRAGYLVANRLLGPGAL